MATSATSEWSYLPPLDKWLTGETQVIGWRTAYNLVREDPDNTVLEHFLNDPDSVSILRSPLEPFRKPSTKSASDFENRTAPIHVTQAGESVYDIEELKSDAKWLSKELQIEELEALRLAVLERQGHISTRFQNAPSDESASVPLAASLSAADGAASNGATIQPVNAAEDRHVALVGMYHSERDHILKLVAYLASRLSVSKGQGLGHLPGSLFPAQSRAVWLDRLAAQLLGPASSIDHPDDLSNSCRDYVVRLRELFDGVEDSKSWPQPIIALNIQEAFIKAQFSEICQILRLLLAKLYTLKGIPRASLISTWFALMKKLEFFQDGTQLFAAAGIDVSPLQLLISVICVEILRANFVIESILGAAELDSRSTETNTYLDDAECLKMIHEAFRISALRGLNLAAPAVLAWSAITSVIQEISLVHQDASADAANSTRRTSVHWTSEFEKATDLLSRGMGETIDDPSRWFAATAVDGLAVMSVLSTLATTVNLLFGSNMDSAVAYVSKEALFDVLRHTIALVQFGSEVLEALLSLLVPCSEDDTSRIHTGVLAGRVLNDLDQLRPAILDQALARYPHELSPLVRLLTALASARNESGRPANLPVVHLLDNLPSLTLMVPENFTSYQLEHENMNSNEMVLTDNLPLFLSRQDLVLWSSGYVSQPKLMAAGAFEDQSTALVAAGTLGTIVKEPRPFVFKLEHEHSGLEYLGLLLYSFTPNSARLPAAPGATLDRFAAAELVSLLVSLLNACLEEDDSSSEAQHLLGRLSNALSDQLDIVMIISEIFEAELMGFLDQNPQDGSLELVTASAEFFAALVTLSPERVWSTLARSSLLGVVDGAASLASVVGGGEIQSGRYRFLGACVRLHSNLLNDAISGLVKRKAQGSKTTTSRFERVANFRDSTPERTMSAVLNAFQKILLDAIQNIPDWKFSVPSERCDLLTSILESFTKLLTVHYGIGLADQAANDFTNVLSIAADALRDSCAPDVGPSPLPEIFSRLLPNGLLVTEDGIPAGLYTSVVAQTNATLSFLTAVLRTAIGHSATADSKDLANRSTHTEGNQPRKSVGDRAVTLATDMLRCLPNIVSLLAAGLTYKSNAYPLLSAIVSTIGSAENDPPSLLGSFAPHVAREVLILITRIDRPLLEVRDERKIWDFFSTIMSSKQQWVSIFLLTGRLPKTRSKGGEHERIKGKTVLGHALDQLSDINNIAPERALGMLKFLALAQQTLVWSTEKLRSHPQFLRKTVAWLDNLKNVFKESASSSDALLRRAREYEMAAWLCDVLAINVHASLETGDKTVLKGLIPQLAFLRDFGVAVDAYNRSLHRNLADNFLRRFPQCKIAEFERTPINPAPFGTEYFYDREIAAQVLGHDESWSGGSRGNNKGFSEELLRANINMSLVSAQLQLLRSWKTLTTTLCECADQDPNLHTAAAKVAEKCLLANAAVQLDEPCMAEALELRLELAFIVASRLVAQKVDGQFMKELLPAAWELVISSPADYDIATSIEDVQYYRRLLQVLYLAIQPHTYIATSRVNPSSDEIMEYLPASTSTILVSIAGKVIAPGFRALCANLHSNIQLALPADFALLTALLQAIVSVPGISSVQTLLSDIVAGSSIIRGALSLYSWSDQLAEVTGSDPVYGEVAMTFLLALSTIRPVAEQMALDGVLIQLSSANLSNYYRKANGKGPFDEPSRMFSIWTEGYLPLCLNLLDAVGPPIAAEVAVFLNTFPEQLRRAARSLDNEQPSPRNPNGGAITLGTVSEAHSLAMIGLIVNSDIARGAAEGINAADIPELDFDLPALKARVETLWRNKRALRDRITPTNALEARWQKTRDAAPHENVLEAKIFKEMASMLACFGGSGGSE